MKKIGKPLIWSCILLAIVNLIWLGYNSYMYADIPKTANRPDTFIILIFLGLILLFFVHLLILLTVSLTLQRSQQMYSAGIILLALGAVSFLAIIPHLSGVMDIGKEYPKGWSIADELREIWIAQAIHVSFLLYTIIYFAGIVRKSGQIDISNSVFREQIFSALNITGIVCSIVGMIVVWIYFDNFNIGIIANHRLRRYDIIPFGFVLLPYLFVLTGWGITFINDRLKGIFDEKQVSDINRSGMVALLVSLPLIILLTISCYLKSPAIFNEIYIAGTVTVLWFPFYLFLVLFVFSVTALYNYRNN